MFNYGLLESIKLKSKIGLKNKNVKTSQLIKEIKTKIETFTYDGIDEAIKLAEEHGTADFFDKF